MSWLTTDLADLAELAQDFESKGMPAIARVVRRGKARTEQLEVLAELCDQLLGKRRRMMGSKHSYLPDNDDIRDLLTQIQVALNRADGRER